MDLGAFGRPEFPIRVAGFGATQQPQAYGVDTPTITPPAQAMIPMSMFSDIANQEGQIPIEAEQPTPPPEEVGILAPDPMLMSVAQQKNQLRAVLKYALLGVLGLGSGALVAHQTGGNKLTGGIIGGVLAIAFVAMADVIRLQQEKLLENLPIVQ